MGLIPDEKMMVHELQQLNEKMDRVIELLSAMNGNLTSIKGNTRPKGGPLGT